MNQDNDFLTPLQRLLWQLKQNLRFIVLGVVVLILLSFVVNSSFVKIVTNDHGNKVYIVSDKNGKTRTKKIRIGWNILKPGENVIKVTSKSTPAQSSVGHLHVKRFHFNQFTLNTQPQKNLIKTVSSSEGCVFGTMTLLKEGYGYSYNCNQGPVYKHSFENKPEKDDVNILSSISGGIAYQDGLIGFVTTNSNVSTAVQPIFTDGKSIQAISLPNNTAQYEPGYSFVLPIDKVKFLIVNTKKRTMLLYKNSTDNSPYVYNFSKDFEVPSNQQVYVTATQALVTVTSNTSKGRSENSSETGDGVLQNYTLTNSGKITKQNKYKVPSSIGVFGLSTLSNNLFVKLDINNNLGLYLSHNNTLKSYSSINNVLDYIVINNTLYYISGNSIYQFDAVNNVSNLLFSNNNLSFTDLSNYDGNLSAYGYSINSPEIKSNFIITNHKREPNQLVDILPYAQSETSTLFSDYSSSKIYFLLDITSAYTDKSVLGGKLMYDQNEVKTKESVIINKLKNDKIDTEKYKILFNFY